QDHATVQVQKSWSTESGSPPGLVALGEDKVVTPVSDYSSRRKEDHHHHHNDQQHEHGHGHEHEQEHKRNSGHFSHEEGEEEEQNSSPYTHQHVQIVRVGSTTESIVDSWAPALAMRQGQGVFDTAPYNDGEDLEQQQGGGAAGRLTRPTSRRLNTLSNFVDGYRSRGGESTSTVGAGGSDGGDEALTLRLSRPASRRGMIPMFGEEYGASYGSN
ncbi:unnamed protein product, partial [Laminaria digitata]